MQSTTGFIKNKAGLAALVFLVFSLGVSSCKKDSDPEDEGPPAKIAYSATFVKSSASVTTTATGTVKGNLDPTTREFTYEVKWNGLTSEVADMHFHDAGPVIIGIKGFVVTTTGTHSDKATFTAEQVTDLNAGKIYVQIHTANYPGGEVIATLAKGTGTGPGGSDPPPY